MLEHLADQLFTAERCKQILQDIVEETGLLRQKTAQQRRQVQKDLEHVDKRITKWQEAFEADDKAAMALGGERVTELKAKREELQEMLRKVVPLRPPPPNLYTEASLKKFQDSIRSIFVSGDNALTKNYLRFLLEKVVVTGAQVQLVMRNEAVARMMVATSAGGGNAAPERDPAVSPTFVVDWLRLQDSNLRPGG